MAKRKDRVTVRLYGDQMLCLRELSAGLDTPISCLIRAIIGDFIKKNEETLERIATKKINKSIWQK